MGRDGRIQSFAAPLPDKRFPRLHLWSLTHHANGAGVQHVNTATVYISAIVAADHAFAMAQHVDNSSILPVCSSPTSAHVIDDNITSHPHSSNPHSAYPKTHIDRRGSPPYVYVS